MAKIIGVAIQKGGVGKTVISVNTAYLLAENNYPHKGKTKERKPYKVTVMDFDPQCNATMALLLRGESTIYDNSLEFEPEQTTASLFGWSMVGEGDEAHIEWNMEQPFPPAIEVPPVYGSYYKGQISCIPGHKSALAETDLMEPLQALEVAERVRDYAAQSDADYIIIDCSPQLGVRQLVAMLASDYLVTPVNADLFSEKGLAEFLQTFNDVKSANPTCQLRIIPNNFDFKVSATMAKLESLRNDVGEFMTEGVIPRSGAVNNAIDTGRPIWRRPPSGNDAAVGNKVRAALSELLASFGIDAK